MKPRWMTWGTVLVLAMFVGAGCAETGEEATGTTPAAVEDAAVEASSGHMVATFAIPSIDDAMTKKLTAALADNPGVLTAKADADSGLYKVAFRTDQTSPRIVFSALSKVHRDVSLRDVVAARSEAGAHECGGCPMQSTCGDTH